MPVTASFGVAALRAEDKLEDVVMRADAALYEAKRGGIGPEIAPTGDYAADMIEAQRFYESKGIAVPDFAAMRNADDSPI